MESQIKQLQKEKDLAIGEKFLAIAKQKEQQEEIQELNNKLQAYEGTLVDLKFKLANMTDENESLKYKAEYLENLKLQYEQQIAKLSQQNELYKKQIDFYMHKISKRSTYSNKNTPRKPLPLSKNIRPFPSTGIKLNFNTSNRPSLNASLQSEDDRRSYVSNHSPRNSEFI